MEALTPSSTSTASSVPVAPPAPAPRAAPEERHPVPHPPVQPTEPLPALPLSVQRSSLEAPQPKVMTKEQMAALLDLVV